MGSVKRDLNARELSLESKYPLDSPDGVHALLSEIHQIKVSRFYRGDFAACGLLLDLIIARGKVKLTRRQREALNLVFIQDLTQKEAAKVMNCTQQAVQQHVWAGISRIARQYRKDLEGIANDGKEERSA